MDWGGGMGKETKEHRMFWFSVPDFQPSLKAEGTLETLGSHSKGKFDDL